MRRSFLALMFVSSACANPVVLDTDTDTETDGSSTGTDTGGDPTSATMTTSATMSSASMTDATSLTTSGSNTTADPDSSSSDPSDTASSTTDTCTPGELDCPCDVGSTCVDDLLCEDGVCVAEPACEEPEGEPNDDEASAIELAEATCGQPPMVTMGGLDGAESDWFTYHADEGFGCFDDPNVVVTADIDLAVCVFAECDMNMTSVQCSNGAVEDDSPDGAPGCCDQNAVGFGNINCGFGGSSATIWVRITSVDAACVPYELEWGY